MSLVSIGLGFDIAGVLVIAAPIAFARKKALKDRSGEPYYDGTPEADQKLPRYRLF